MESVDCVAAAGSLRSGVNLHSWGRDRHRVLLGICGCFLLDGMCPLAYGYEIATKETSAGCYWIGKALRCH